jgi:uncharacterized protein YozE (UPF0346 family)
MPSGTNGPSDAALPLPLKVEQLDAHWLSTALQQRHAGVTVTAAQVQEVMLGTSTKVRVALQYDAAGQEAGLPPTLIVKGGFQEHSPLFGFMYESEMRSYRDIVLALKLPMNTPRCYFAARDPDSHQSIVILEDLKARGVRFCRAQDALSFDQVSSFLDAQARYHAAHWDDPALADGGELGWLMEPFDRNSMEYADRYLKREVWAQCMDLPRALAVPARFRDGARMRSALEALAQSHGRLPRCIAHGDTHLGNLYLEASGKPGFFDLQIRRSCWVQDLAYHLVCALDIEDRRAWEQPLLAWYLSRLQHYGVAQAPAFDQAWDAYRCEIVYGLFIFLINETRFQSEATNTAYSARFGAAAADHRSFERLGV